MKFFASIFGLLLLVCSLRADLNVTNSPFSAVGDAVQFYANTVSNSDFITTTNIFSIADIGKAIEVFKCGTNTSGTNCQDMVTTIANVVNGTNIYLNQICQNTLTNTFATVGTDNSLAISNAIQTAVSMGTNVIINVPTGKYLCLANFNTVSSAPLAIQIHGGGWHLIGEGMTNSVLLGQGAWTLRSGYGVMRGFLLAIQPTITNDFYTSIENLTLDGGVQVGNTAIHGTSASQITGEGWDQTHDAIDIRGTGGGSFTHWTWTNVAFVHWRGEMVKSNNSGGQTNGNLIMVNCTFRDGNATAINIYDSPIITNCIFDNLFQIGEYYQKYSTNAAFMIDCVFTNITGNGWAFNGGTINCPHFTISNCVFSVAGNAFGTTPGDNITLTSNRFINCGNCVVIGESGYQGYTNNRNIEISFNHFTNSGTILQMGDSSQFASNTCDNISFHNNLAEPPIRTAFATVGWGFNISIYSNTIPLNADGTVFGTTIALGNYGAPMPLFQTNNEVYTRILYSATNVVLPVSYAQGSCFQFVYRTLTNSVIALVTTNATQLPTGAAIILTNSSFTDPNSDGKLTVYGTSDQSDTPVVIPQYGQQTFYFTGSAWNTNSGYTPSVYQLVVFGGTGSGFYSPGTPVVVTAIVPPRNRLIGWTDLNGVLDNTNSATATATTISQDISVTANFFDTNPPVSLNVLGAAWR